MMESTSFVSYKYLIGSFMCAYEYVFPEFGFLSLEGRLRKALLETFNTSKVSASAVRAGRGNNEKYFDG